MSKPLQFQFDTGTWLKDPAVSGCSLSTRGAWMDILCYMHEKNRCGQIIGSYIKLARICRCSVEEITVAVNELRREEVADVTEFISEESSGSNAIVTITNRRMRRDFDARDLTAKRQQKFRDNNRNIPTSTEAKRIAAVFRRLPDTPWSDGEIASFKTIGKISDEDLTVVELFYKHNKHNEKAWLRTGLQAFCNNFRGEIDKAKSWAHKNPKTVNGNIVKIEQAEPAGARDWLITTFPQATEHHKKPWGEIPQDIRKKFV